MSMMAICASQLGRGRGRPRRRAVRLDRPFKKERKANTDMLVDHFGRERRTAGDEIHFAGQHKDPRGGADEEVLEVVRIAINIGAGTLCRTDKRNELLEVRLS